MKKMTEKNGNSKQIVDFTEMKSRVVKPRTFAGTALEVGGSGPCGNGAMRNVDHDFRHLLAYLFDLCRVDGCIRVFIETRWSEGLGLIISKL